MLLKRYRINKENDVKSIKQKGLRAQTPLFTLIYKKTELPNPRFGFIVSKKTNNKTTKRNLIKRRMRHVISKNLKQIKKGFDCIFVAKSEIINNNFEEIEKEIKKTLAKESLLWE